MTQTLTAYTDNAENWAINLKEFSQSNSIYSFFLYLFGQFGELGNDIFFVCTAYFLVDSRKTYGKKIVNLLTKVWIVSVMILMTVLLSRSADLNGSTILRCLFPSTFSNNWYITNYVLFLIIVPFLNFVLDRMSQKQHLLFTLFIIVLCMVVKPFTKEWSNSIPSLSIDEWIRVYFLIAYMKKYLRRFSSSISRNILLLFCGLCVAFVTLNAHIVNCNSLMTIVLYSWYESQFYLYVIAIALFNLFRGFNFKSKLLNWISSYSMLIYITHENLLIRKIYRPMIWNYIYENLGYSYVVLWIVLLSLATFMCSLVVSIIFEMSIGKILSSIIDKHYSKFRLRCSDILGRMINIQ